MKRKEKWEQEFKKPKDMKIKHCNVEKGAEGESNPGIWCTITACLPTNPNEITYKGLQHIVYIQIVNSLYD